MPKYLTPSRAFLRVSCMPECGGFTVRIWSGEDSVPLLEIVFPAEELEAAVANQRFFEQHQLSLYPDDEPTILGIRRPRV